MTKKTVYSDTGPSADGMNHYHSAKDFVSRPYPRVQVEFTEPTRTRHSESVYTDLNTIVAKYQKAGALPPSDLLYGDVSDFPVDRLEALQRIDAAREAFESLPFKVRQAVDHDPRLLEQWIAANPAQAREFGLLRPVDLAPQPSSPETPEDDKSSAAT